MLCILILINPIDLTFNIFYAAGMTGVVIYIYFNRKQVQITLETKIGTNLVLTIYILNVVNH
jgi:hypothetical protein